MRNLQIRTRAASIILVLLTTALCLTSFSQAAESPIDTGGLVLHCGSFSKCLAPGYRLGWVAAGRYAQELVRRKIESSLSTSLPIQLGVTQMLRFGGYESHLSRLRRILGRQVEGERP